MQIDTHTDKPGRGLARPRRQRKGAARTPGRHTRPASNNKSVGKDHSLAKRKNIEKTGDKTLSQHTRPASKSRVQVMNTVWQSGRTLKKQEIRLLAGSIPGLQVKVISYIKQHVKM